MSRHPLPLGTWGKVSRRRISPGSWRAATRYRDTDGVTRTVQAFGATGAAAERALALALKDRLPSPPPAP